MKKLQKLFTSSIFMKIALLTSLVVVFIYIFSTTFLVNHFTRNLQGKNYLLIEEATDKLYDFFQTRYNIIFNQSTLLHSSDYIADSIALTRQYPSDIYTPKHLNKITNYLSALTSADPHIQDVILFTADGKNSFSHSTASGSSVYLGFEFNKLSYIKDFSDSDSGITAIYDATPPYLASSKKETKPVITFITKIFNMNDTSRPLLGYLMVNYPINDIESSYQKLMETSSGDYYVINSDSTIIFSNKAGFFDDSISSMELDKKNLISRKQIGLSGLEVISILDTEKENADARQIILYSVFITGAGIIVAMFVFFLLYHYYAKKFKKLSHAMENISTGNFSLKLPVNSNDELGQLSNVFNTMSNKLDEYIQKHYLSETQRRTAELYALQAQINPHFLANTIESIRMHTLKNDDYESSEMLKRLGNLFQWMIHFDENIIYIEDEMEYIESYLDLQKFRFQDQLTVMFDVPIQFYYLGIPRFTLQPIIENALSHGAPNNRPLCISIQFTVSDELLTITVTDNGTGLAETDLQKLNLHIQGIQEFSEFGVALRNIHTRIQMLFGTQYGIFINSTHYQGTTVTITLPAKEKKELENYVQTTDCR